MIKKPVLFTKKLIKILLSKSEVNSVEVHLKEAIKWLRLAQKSTRNGGVSAGYHLYHGWLPSYPETTGYIIETIFDYAILTGIDNYRQAGLSMVEWLCEIQHPDGSMPDPSLAKKMVFDTGQALFGFIRSYQETGDKKYLECARKAGDWLSDVQEDGGMWIKYAARDIPHTYYSRVAWSLLELYKVINDERYLNKCKRNINWCLEQQQRNGWFNNAAFTTVKHSRPFTHTIAYTIRGILETAIFLDETKYMDSVLLAVGNLLSKIHDNGFVSATFDRNWEGNDRFSCLTGNAQLAIILFKLFELTQNETYYHTALNINNFLKLRQNISIDNMNIRGGIAGSYPIWGNYIHYNYPNWAAKFFVDSLLQEYNFKKNGEK